MTNIVSFGGYTRNDIDPDNVLEGSKGQCKTVLVLGFDDNDILFSASSTAKVGEMLRIVELFKFKLMRGDFD